MVASCNPKRLRLGKHFAATAREAGFTIALTSAYRSEAHQATLYRRKAGGTSEAAINRTLQLWPCQGTQNTTPVTRSTSRTMAVTTMFLATLALMHGWLLTISRLPRPMGGSPATPATANRQDPTLNPGSLSGLEPPTSSAETSHRHPNTGFVTLSVLFSAQILTGWQQNGLQPAAHPTATAWTRRYPCSSCDPTLEHSGEPEVETDLPSLMYLQIHTILKRHSGCSSRVDNRNLSDEFPILTVQYPGRSS